MNVTFSITTGTNGLEIKTNHSIYKELNQTGVMPATLYKVMEEITTILNNMPSPQGVVFEIG